HLPAAARVFGVARHDIGGVDLPPAVFALDAHHLVGAGEAVDHRHRSGKAAPAQMLPAQLAEPDPRPPDKPAAGKVDPGAHHRQLLRTVGKPTGMARLERVFVKKTGRTAPRLESPLPDVEPPRTIFEGGTEPTSAAAFGIDDRTLRTHLFEHFL